ncbi:MAG: LamG domain-containing protein [Proteobacteria bacterium]|nr:LamG domain-containing protein [Pseudomonadota bacterium]
MTYSEKMEETGLAIFYACVLGVAVYSLIYFLTNKIYLIGSDAFYYMAIADSVFQTGALADITSVPAMGVKTPQNGIVFIHLVLRSLGLGAEDRLIAIVIINFIMHVGAAYPLYRIAGKFGVESRVSMAALLGVYLCAFHIYRFQLLALNDGIFNSLTIWLTFFIVVLFKDYPDQALRKPLQHEKLPRLLACLLLLSIALPHFRLHANLVFGAALLAAVIAGRPRAAILFLCLLIISVASSLLTYTFFVESDRLTAYAGKGGATFLDGRFFKISRLMHEGFPRLLFGDGPTRPGKVICAVFGLSLLLTLIPALRKRDPAVLFVCLSCAVAILFLLTSPWINRRYYVYIFPLIYMIILMKPQTRQIGFLAVMLVFLSSINLLQREFPRQPPSRFWLYLNQHPVMLSDANPLLISSMKRHPYFFLQTPSFREKLTWERILSHKGVYILGDKKFIGEKLSIVDCLAGEAGFIYKRKALTPDYRDKDGHRLLHLYDFRPAFSSFGNYDEYGCCVLEDTTILFDATIDKNQLIEAYKHSGTIKPTCFLRQQILSSTNEPGCFDRKFLDKQGKRNTKAHLVAGIVGNALAFDGVDEYIDCGPTLANDVLAAEHDFSIAFWWKTPTEPLVSGSAALQKWDQVGKESGFSFFHYADHRFFLRFIFVEPDGNRLVQAVFNHSNDGLWHHYVAKRDRTTFTFYRDGERVKTDTTAGNAANLATRWPLTIAKDRWAGYAKGAMDDFRIYGHALPEEEIQTLFNQRQDS